MLSGKFIFSCSVVARLVGLAFAVDLNYWTSTVADGKVGFSDALAEVIWASGQLADAIKAGDTRIDGPLKWFFNVEAGPSTPKDDIENTYRRLNSLQRAADQASSLVRFEAGKAEHYKRKNHKGEVVPDAPTLEKQMKKGYHDEGNDMWAIGKDIASKVNKEGVQAQTYPFIAQINKELMKNHQESQREDRAVIEICEAAFDQDINPLWSAPTFRELAQARLDIMEDITNLNSHVALTITHELIHVPALSRQENIRWPLEISDKYVSHVGDHGKDIHGALRLSGYYRDGKLPGETLDDWQFTVMNPESYAYVLMIFRLIQKQWEPILSEKDGKKLITFKKRTDWELVGDWPDAGPTPPLHSREGSDSDSD